MSTVSKSKVIKKIVIRSKYYKSYRVLKFFFYFSFFDKNSKFLPKNSYH